MLEAFWTQLWDFWGGRLESFHKFELLFHSDSSHLSGKVQLLGRCVSELTEIITNSSFAEIGNISTLAGLVA